MLIGNKYKVESEALNVVLSEKVKSHKKDTKEEYYSWQVLGFFSRPEHALKALVNLKVKETKLKDLRTVVDKIKEVEAMIKLALKEK